MRNGKLITLLSCLILSLSVIGCKTEERNPNPEHPLLLISFDGFRHDYLDFTHTPHFDSLVAGGTKAEGLIPVFPTKTFPNHYSIATGLYPEHTGLVANTMYDPEQEEWYRIRNREAVEDPKWYGGEPIWNTAESSGLQAGTMFWVGSEAPIQNMRPTYWKTYDGALPGRARIDTVVNWLTAPEGKRVDFATLYFELVDDAGHRYGIKSDSLIKAIQKSDELIGYLKHRLRQEGIWDGINIIIVSDHGMVDLSADKTIMLDAIINPEHAERTIWSPVTMIQPKEGRAEEMYRSLKENEKQHHYRVFRKENLPDRYHLKGHRRVPELVVVADLGYTILNEETRERFIGRLPAATHGYDNGAKAMRAFFGAYGPSFKRGEKIGVFQNIHLYELMCHLLNIKPAPNDGSLDSVQVMLKQH